MEDRAVSAADYPRQSNLPQLEVDTRALREVYDGFSRDGRVNWVW